MKYDELTKLERDHGIFAPRNDAVGVEFEDHMLKVMTRDGRVIQVPLDWFPWLESASDAQRDDYRIYNTSIFWPQLDEGIEMQTILLGRYLT